MNRKQCILSIFAAACCALTGCTTMNAPIESQTKAPAPEIKGTNHMIVELNTSKGLIKLELNEKAAPKTVANFIAYAKSGHYDGTIFHRVIKGFMVQGGGFDKNFQQKAAPNTVKNEADNGLSNDIGTVAMARTSDPDSAGAQFFINVSDNVFLNHSGKTQQGWGYCVFGKVIEGLDVVKQIEGVATGNHGHFQDVPKEDIMIITATVSE